MGLIQIFNYLQIMREKSCYNYLMTLETPKKSACLRKELDERILVMDGAMGTLIQEHRLSQDDYHGKRFSEHPSSLMLKLCESLAPSPSHT